VSKRDRKSPAAKSGSPAKSATPASTGAAGNQGSAGLLGIGLDHTDGHKRITTGEKFVLVGGSAETHDRMAETTLKTFEELKRRAKHLETIDRRELAEIIHKSTPR
jgi:PAB1-binding protein PBP1